MSGYIGSQIPSFVSDVTSASGDFTIGSDLTVNSDATVSGGIYLGGTGSANYLDDYEEGTWTPTLLASTTNPTVTYDTTFTNASYRKVGNTVFFSFEVRTTARSGGSGVVRIGGLPFTRINDYNPDGDHLSISPYNVTFTGSGTALVGIVGQNNTYINIASVKSGSAGADFVITDWASSGLAFVRGSGLFRV